MRRTCLTAIALLAAASLSGLAVSRIDRPPPALISVAAGELDLGTRDESAAVTHRFHLVNPTADPVRVSSVGGTCDCLSLAPNGPFELAAGERREVTATVALRMKSACQRSRGDSESARIPIFVAAGAAGRDARTFEFVLTAAVRPALRVPAGAVAFGLQSVRPGGFERTLPVEVAPHVRRIGYDAPPAWTVKMPDLSAGEREVSLWVRSTGPPVPRVVSDTITLTPFGEDGVPLPASSILVTGEFAADVQATPRVVCFGRRPIGAEAEEVVVLRSLGGYPFRVLGWRADDGLTLEAVRAGGEPAYRVRGWATAAGEQERAVTFEVDGGEASPVFLRVPVTVYGTDERGGP